MPKETTVEPGSIMSSVGAAEEVAGAVDMASAMVRELERIVLARPEAIRDAVITVLASGHLLVQDVPGVGKTLLTRALAAVIGGSFVRIQGTADLLPTDITGVSVFRPDTSDWEFRPGPVFANVVLVDEINRATPRAQSALLEAMEERQVSVDGQTWELPDPWVLVATQNSLEHAGTFPLPDGQLDRFLLRTSLGYPPPEAEARVVRGEGGPAHLHEIAAVGGVERLRQAQHAVASAVWCSEAVSAYVVGLCAATRAHPAAEVGASPRAAVALMAASRAHAVFVGREFVTPDDVQGVAHGVLDHRLVMAGATNSAESVVDDALKTVAVPRS